MTTLFKFLKRGLLVALAAVIMIGGIKFMVGHEREAGHAQYQYQAGNDQRGEYQGHQAKQFYPEVTQGDQREGVRGNNAYQRNEPRAHGEYARGDRGHGHEWGAYALIPLIGACLVILLAWMLLRRTNSRYVKWGAALLLAIMLWPLALAALVIYAIWKLFNITRRPSAYPSERYLVNQGFPVGTDNQIHSEITNVDFLDEWEQRAKSKRNQEDSE